MHYKPVLDFSPFQMILGKKPDAAVETGFDLFATNPLPLDDADMTVANLVGEGKAFTGGPVCDFQGKKLPTLCQWSEGGGINPDILVNILKKIDSSGVLARSKNVKPFLLVDAHQSRLSLEFLKYIRNQNHPWRVCISVPYDTHLWQVADSEELNGELSRLFTLGKEELIQKKSSNGMEPTGGRQDIMPTYTPAWKGSFGQVNKNKKAMAARGWSVLNYYLLDDHDVVKTMQVSDLKKEYAEKFGKYFGQHMPSDKELTRALAIESAGRPQACSQSSLLGVKDLNFTGGIAMRVVDDLIIGETSKKHRASMRDRADLSKL